MATATYFTVCPNPECKRTTVVFFWGKGRTMMDGKEVRVQWAVTPQEVRVAPPTYARPLSSAVPAPVLEDYEEACAIVERSPKAAATLARRALQGMIRDFHGIIKPTLHQEILALQGKVDPDLWDAIDAVRGVGNIGAHMEKDINLIVDVDPGEALQLVRLIELLSEEWYATREKRKRQLTELKALGDQKQNDRKGTPAGGTSAPTQSATS